MVDEFIINSWSQRMVDIDAQRVQAQADLAVARAQDDTYSASDAIERIAQAEQRLGALSEVHQRYTASQNPSAGRQVDLTPDEAARICGVDAATYNRGVYRLQALKAQGLYKE